MDTIRLADVIAKDLEARILEGSLRPGERLPAERELAEQLGVSRPSLREALQMLASKGLLRKRQGGGTFVTDTLQASFADPWKAMLGQHPGLRQDLLELRDMLEGQVARLAAERATAVDRTRIEAAFQALEQAYAGDDLQACIVADAAFHQSVAEASHNALLAHLNASLARLVFENIEGSLQATRHNAEHWRQLRKQHRDICQCIVGGQANRAALAAHRHIAFLQRVQHEHSLQETRLQSAERRLLSASVPPGPLRAPNRTAAARRRSPDPAADGSGPAA